ncbi:hypothetical protein [Bosea sp. NBC_00550]|uniref:hypothetical protein n=1 Tax=Bosea sp. NBC_00550 TaxID=2969621 RepID=UPI00222EEB08|nr:hypothetical protein [Bosea sp. NBC_00550]UZF93719.1 hypothetical protein NWE53_05865 [Bosea sp. NBC_00550]
MARPCSVCTHPQTVAINTALANGVPAKRVAAQFGLSNTSTFRHRTNCLNGVGASRAIVRQASHAAVALASLPSADEVGQAYSSIGRRLDGIIARCEAEGSTATAILGLKELRGVVTAQAHLAGHLGNGGPTVAIQNNVSIDVGSVVRELLGAIGPMASTKTLARLERLVDGE